MNGKSLLIAAFLFFPARTFALEARLEEAERRALDTSPKLQAARAERDAAQERARGQFTRLLPRLGAEGYWKRVSVVPSISPIPGGPSIRMGDNENYSIGPAVNWMMWDSGMTWRRWKSLQASEDAKSEEARAVERELRLKVRQTYFQAWLSAEQRRLLQESLELTRDQHRDMTVRFDSGLASRQDFLTAHQEVLAREKLFLQAEADLACALRDLYALTNDRTLPELLVTSRTAVSFELRLDSYETARARLGNAARAPFDPGHPSIESLARLAEASRLAALSAAGQHGPEFLFSAKTSMDYPNGPTLERIHQNTVGVTMNFPLYEFGRVQREVAEKRKDAEAGERRADQLRVDLERDWRKSREQYFSLLNQRDIQARAVTESAEIARLAYENYRAGRSRFLEVQDANLRTLESEVQASRIEAMILTHLSVLDSLSRTQ